MHDRMVLHNTKSIRDDYTRVATAPFLKAYTFENIVCLFKKFEFWAVSLFVFTEEYYAANYVQYKPSHVELSRSYTISSTRSSNRILI